MNWMTPHSQKWTDAELLALKEIWQMPSNRRSAALRKRLPGRTYKGAKERAKKDSLTDGLDAVFEGDRHACAALLARLIRHHGHERGGVAV